MLPNWLFIVLIPATLMAAVLALILQLRQRHRLADEVQSRTRQLYDERELFRTLSHNTAAGIFIARLHELVAVNPALCEILGRNEDTLIGMDWRALVHPQDRATVEARAAARLRGDRVPARYAIRIIRQDGSPRWVELSAGRVQHHGHPAIIGTLFDINRRYELEQALRHSEAKYRQLVENVNDIIYTVSPEGVLTYVSPNWPELLGHEAETVTGRNIAEFVHPDDLPACMEFLERLYLTGKKQSGIEYRVKHANGTWRWHTSNASPLYGDNGGVEAYVGIARDVTDRKSMEGELLYQLRFTELVADLSTRFVRSYAEDIDSVINDMLARAGRFFGVDRTYFYMFSDDGTTLCNTHEWCAPGVDSMIQKSQAVSLDGYPWWRQRMEALRNRHDVVFIEDVDELPPEAAAEQALLRDQRVRTLYCVPVATPDRVIGFLGFDSLAPRDWRRDQGDLLVVLGNLLAAALARKALEEELRGLSVTDPLTGLFNRRFLRARLVALIEEYERTGRNFCLSLLDLDHFKQLNDEHGHLAGDRALQDFAGILRENHRVFDIVARYGGEEFVVVLVETEMEQARAITSRVLETTREFSFSHDGTVMPLTASAGLADISELPQDQRNVENLLQLADRRLYQAKQKGRDRLVAH